jgi:tetratricopeptide (TPR) repeat protein
MSRSTMLGWIGAGLIAAGALLTGRAAGQAEPEADRAKPVAGRSAPAALNEAVAAAISAAWLSEEERRAMRFFHGVWTPEDLAAATADQRAVVALNAWQFDDPALADPTAAVEVRAEAMLLQGDLEAAAAMTDGVSTNRAARIRAEALEGLGRHEQAGEAVDGPVRRLMREKTDDARELTEGVRALVVRARLQGQPARDFQTMLNLLTRAHQELDRLYWPARLAEADLLLDKDNQPEAIEALEEVLSYNPRCADAWFMVGRAAVSQFNFDGARETARRLRDIHPAHPLADLLLAESSLVQGDPDAAMALLSPLLERLPRLRPALALLAAAHAIAYEEDATRNVLARCDELSPGSPLAHYVVGRHLALNRQYDAAAELLSEAIRRQPAWPAPQIELGLMELQSGRDEVALDALQQVAELDPFNKRAANSLFLLQELADYRQIETEHFVIRYKPGLDEVTATLMPQSLERLHDTVTARFRHEPDRRTVIELLPDHQRFGVRITGMPFIHTVAACTGPVIALEVPREGPPSKHLGPFDWPRVLQHEYTHTVTLSQTRNRIPHWLTEAAAVSMELRPRRWETCTMLARAEDTGTLFSLDEINWAFIRPKKPADRGMAYAQGHWMVEYINERWGDSALIRLLARYFEGEREHEAMPAVLGLSRGEFFRDFLVWAAEQVKVWGLAPTPSITELMDEERWNDPELALDMLASTQARLDVIVRKLTGRIGEPAATRDRNDRREITADQWPPLVRPPLEITDEMLDRWLAAHPDHPSLNRLRLERLIEAAGGVREEHVPLLERCAALCPVDPWPHLKLAQLRLGGADPAAAIPHLEFLDAREENDNVYAVELAKLYRRGGDRAMALEKSLRAVNFNPYHAANRELAAAIAIESGRLDMARMHIHALTLIEPDRPQHARRLEAIDRRLSGQPGAEP